MKLIKEGICEQYMDATNRITEEMTVGVKKSLKKMECNKQNHCMLKAVD